MPRVQSKSTISFFFLIFTVTIKINYKTIKVIENNLNKNQSKRINNLYRLLNFYNYLTASNYIVLNH